MSTTLPPLIEQYGDCLIIPDRAIWGDRDDHYVVARACKYHPGRWATVNILVSLEAARRFIDAGCPEPDDEDLVAAGDDPEMFALLFRHRTGEIEPEGHA
jgi:hypothetical protein